jgi:hypothetical protein
LPYLGPGLEVFHHFTTFVLCLFKQESSAGRIYVKLREMGIEAEREWMVNEAGSKVRG